MVFFALSCAFIFKRNPETLVQERKLPESLGHNIETVINVLEHLGVWFKMHPRPRSLGLAYDFQRVATIQHEPWDIPMHAIATDSKIYYCRHNQAVM